MALYDLSDPAVPLPPQLVVDTSLLLSLRPGDDNPHAAAARTFIRRMGERIAAYELAAWLPVPVLQECYHVIMANGLRRTWETLDPTTRPPNWLKAYKDYPDLLKPCLPELSRFRDLLAAIPLTPVRPEDLAASGLDELLEDRMHYFITAYHLLSQDALILAEAERLGVTAVATLDQDWRRVVQFDVYTCLQTRS
jgi:predicted nucleic acid-binding protein